MSMPGMTGMELLYWVRKAGPLMLGMILSGQNQPPKVDRFADHWFAKPVDIHALARYIDDQLQVRNYDPRATG